MKMQEYKPIVPAFVLLGIALFAICAFADEASSRAMLAGAWQPQDPAGSEAGAWTLEDKGDVMRVTHSMGDQKLSEFECNTVGHECNIKEAGKSAKVSMWFNGSQLVQLETRGQEVVKRRFAVSDQGDTLEMEVIPILPGGKAETVHYRRVKP